MRWKTNPSSGYRIHRKFLLFPTCNSTIKPDGYMGRGEWRWLEWCDVIQESEYGTWIDYCWGSDLELEWILKRDRETEEAYRRANERKKAKKRKPLTVTSFLCVYCGQRLEECGCGWVKRTERESKYRGRHG